jgi:ribonuclease E
VLRGLEDALMTAQPTSLVASASATVALYILNHKRAFINEMETRYGVSISITASDKMQGANFSIERASRREEPQRRPERAAVSMDWGFEGEGEAAAQEEEAEPGPEEVDGEGRRSRRRRRRRGGRREERPGRVAQGRERHAGGYEIAEGAEDEVGGPRDAGAYPQAGASAALEPGLEAEPAAGGESEFAGEDREGREDRRGRRGRRRGRRGGRRGGDRERGPAASNGVNDGAYRGFETDVTRPGADMSPDTSDSRQAYVSRDDHGESEPGNAAQPDSSGQTRSGAEKAASISEVEARQKSELERADAQTESARTARAEPAASEPVLEHVVVSPDEAADGVVEGNDGRPVRRGWWQRKFGGE